MSTGSVRQGSPPKPLCDPTALRSQVHGVKRSTGIFIFYVFWCFFCNDALSNLLAFQMHLVDTAETFSGAEEPAMV